MRILVQILNIAMIPMVIHNSNANVTQDLMERDVKMSVHQNVELMEVAQQINITTGIKEWICLCRDNFTGFIESH